MGILNMQSCFYQGLHGMKSVGVLQVVLLDHDYRKQIFWGSLILPEQMTINCKYLTLTCNFTCPHDHI